MSPPSAPAHRSYLVFVRAGAQSLHPRLLAENPDRNWDCCVSWYVPPLPEQLAEYYSAGGFNKLDGFLEFWQHRPDPWPWRYVVLLDDDIYLRPGALNRFFELCERYGTYLCQPALNWFTHTTINVLVRNPACVMRRLSFVEVMAPCFSTAALEELLPTFAWTRSTWGTDIAWGCLLEGRQPVHVVDAVGMDHTRTGDGRPTMFYRKLTAMGVDPGQELREILARFPHFGGQRMLKQGHIYRPGVPPALGPVLLLLFEKLKFIVRIRKQVLRNVRAWRAGLQDRWTGASP
jgi:hypothetical protein